MDDEPQDEQKARDRRIEHQAAWVDLEIRRAIERGDFDDLPGAGKPIPDLGTDHDPDWWIRRLIEREQITGVLPPALSLRTEDARLDDTLDRLGSERQVVETLEDFNARVREARRQLAGGPPVITPTRDVEHEVERWRARRAARRQAAAVREAADTAQRRRRRRWFGRRG